MVERADVVVAGGGPAGLATAIRARMEGLDVALFDAASPPIDKACGEGLMPDGVERLVALGVELVDVERMPFQGLRYLDGDLVAEARFPGTGGLGVRRTSLHDALRRRAEDVGVRLFWGVGVRGLLEDGFETDDGSIHGRWLVAADGRGSRVRSWAGLDGRTPRRRRFGVRRHYEIEPWTDLVEVHWTEGYEAYVTPVGERTVGVALMWTGRTQGFDASLVRFPALERRLEGASAASTDRGAGPLERRCRKVVRGRLALVGDASGYLDAISGEGLALSFHHAFAVVEAMAANDLEAYAAAHRHIGRYPRAITHLLLLIGRHPRLRRQVMRSLAGDPTLMARFLALKVRDGGPRMLGADGLVRLAASAVRGGG
jgi:flavin-dependent dehydrogenase